MKSLVLVMAAMAAASPLGDVIHIHNEASTGRHALTSPSGLSAYGLRLAAANEVCWRACFPNSVECPAPGYDKNFGECHTCCFDAGSLGASPVAKETTEASTARHAATPPAPPSVLDLHPNDVCLRVCWPQAPQCPQTWYASNQGSSADPCWTCCKAPELAASRASKDKAAEKFTVQINVTPDEM